MLSLAQVQKVVGGPEYPDDPAWVSSMGEAVMASLTETVARAPRADPFDLWAAAVQYALAAFCVSATARSKVEVRHGVDQMNSMLKSFVASDLHLHPSFLADAPSHLALIAAATAINLAAFRPDPRVLPAILQCVRGAAAYGDRILLLDVRTAGRDRQFRLELVSLLVEAHLGSVGIVQTAAEPVHNNPIGVLPAGILPCVTLYPGMGNPFSNDIESQSFQSVEPAPQLPNAPQSHESDQRPALAAEAAGGKRD
jgi:hypothetical protein